MGWEYMWIFCIVSAALCSVGFKRFVYFLSVGYGFAVAGLGIAYFATAVAAPFPWNFATILQCGLFIAYGARLSGFLLAREIKNASYRKVLKEATKENEKPMPFIVKVCIWLTVSVLYIAQTAPVFFRLCNGDGYDMGLPLLGAVISIGGLCLEAISDRQKTAQKAVEPNMVATKQLFKLVRCPNYLGEVIFWTGVLVGSLNTLTGAGQWITTVAGYVCIVFIMFNGAQRLDRRQEKRYGKIPAYRAYADHTPILLPFVPLYHIGKYKED